MEQGLVSKLLMDVSETDKDFFLLVDLPSFGKEYAIVDKVPIDCYISTKRIPIL